MCRYCASEHYDSTEYTDLATQIDIKSKVQSVTVGNLDLGSAYLL